MPGFLHLYVGQEAVAAGVMATLRDDDVITSTHRGHGHAVAKGADLQGHVRRALRQDHRVLQGPRRQHAHQRPEHRHARRERHRRRRHSARGRARRFAAGYKGSDAVAVPFFGDGATQHRRLPRVGQPRRRHATCRSSSSARTTATPSSPRRTKHMLLKDVADRAAVVRHARRDRRRHGRGRRLPRRQAPGRAGPRRRAVRRCSSARHTATTTTRASRACASRTAPRRRSTTGRRATRSPRSSSAWSRPRSPKAESWKPSGRTRASEIEAAIKFAEDSPDPDPADMLDDVYTVKG